MKETTVSCKMIPRTFAGHYFVMCGSWVLASFPFDDDSSAEDPWMTPLFAMTSVQAEICANAFASAIKPSLHLINFGAAQ